MSKLQTKRGTDAVRLVTTLLSGEPFWTTDTDKLYIGDGSTVGGIEVSDPENLPDLPGTENEYILDVDSSGDGTWVVAPPRAGVTIVSTQTEVDDAIGQGNILFTAVSGLTGPAFAAQQVELVGATQSTVKVLSLVLAENQVAFVTDQGLTIVDPPELTPVLSTENFYYLSSSSSASDIDPTFKFKFATTDLVDLGSAVAAFRATILTTGTDGVEVNSTNFPTNSFLFHAESTSNLDAISWYGDDGNTLKKFTVT